MKIAFTSRDYITALDVTSRFTFTLAHGLPELSNEVVSYSFLETARLRLEGCTEQFLLRKLHGDQYSNCFSFTGVRAMVLKYGIYEQIAKSFCHRVDRRVCVS